MLFARGVPHAPHNVKVFIYCMQGGAAETKRLHAGAILGVHGAMDMYRGARARAAVRLRLVGECFLCSFSSSVIFIYRNFHDSLKSMLSRVVSFCLSQD